jgi:hypothetical protein
VDDAKAWSLEALGPRGSACLWAIAWQESKDDPDVLNHEGSGAYGLFQIKPASKLEAWALARGYTNWQSPVVQARWAVNYARAKYGSVCGAWYFWVENGWW